MDAKLKGLFALVVLGLIVYNIIIRGVAIERIEVPPFFSITFGSPPTPPPTPTVKPSNLTDTPIPPTLIPPNVCSKWDLESDFQLQPIPNPRRDSCGNPEIWSFMSSPSLDRNPNNYILLRYFSNTHDNIVNILELGNKDTEATVVVAVNATGHTINNRYGVWPPNKIVVHPGPSQLGIIGWRSPMDGNIKITGSVEDKDSGCGDGINWFISKGPNDLASGSIDNGGVQDFQNGLGGHVLTSIAISRDERIYLVIGPKKDNLCDSTFVNLTISK